MQYELGGINI